MHTKDEQYLRFFTRIYLILHSPSIRLNFWRQRRKLRSMTMQIQKTLKYCKANCFTTHQEIWNSVLFVNIAFHDLSIAIEQTLFGWEQWKRNFNARILALHLYEIPDDLKHLLGKRTRDSLNRLGLLSHLETDLNNAQKRLNEFRKKHEKELKEVRDFAAAHRDHDALALLRVVNGITPDKIGHLGVELGQILRDDIGAVTTKIFMAASSIEPPERTDTKQGISG